MFEFNGASTLLLIRKLVNSDCKYRNNIYHY